MTKILIKKDLDRYSKQIILKKFGIIGQKKVISSKVLIVGMGGLGCPLALYLAGLGVGKIGIVDNDKIELSNLNRQIIYDYNDNNFIRYEAKNGSIKIFIEEIE